MADDRRRATRRIRHELKSARAFGLTEIAVRRGSAPAATAPLTSAPSASPPPTEIRSAPSRPIEEPSPVPKKTDAAPLAAPAEHVVATQQVLLGSKPSSPAEVARIIDRLKGEVAACVRCKLHQGRTQTVFGEGPLGAELMFIGEGPGADEDATGRPFVGRAGQLLTKIIEAMGRRREDVYIANVVKCRPPQNRTPQPDEIGSCFPYLQEQIRLIGPKVICALGAPATRSLLSITTPMGQARGKIYRLGGIRVVPTFHPAYLLRNPAEKRKVWDDVQLINRLLAGEVGS